MEKRFLLAVVLCLMILMFWQSYVAKQQEEWKNNQEAYQAEQGEEVLQDPSQASIHDPLPAQEALHAERPAHEPEPAGRPEAFLRGEPCEEVVVDTPLYRAVLCSHNGRLMSWKLKEYKILPPCKCPVVEKFQKQDPFPLVDSGPEVWAERIHAQVPDEYPLGLEVSTGKRRVALLERLEPDRSKVDLLEGDDAQQLVFSGNDAKGRKVRRTYTFHPGKYLVDLTIEIEGLDSEIRSSGLGLKLTERISAGSSADRYTFSGFMGFVNGQLEKEKKIKDHQFLAYSGDVSWQGFSDKYFLNCIIPVDNPKSSVMVDMLGPESGERQGLWTSRLVYNVQAHEQEGKARFSYLLYMGPKDQEVLAASEHALGESIDLGWFGFIAEPLLVVLKFFYKYTHNYGIAIILLTIIIKILFHPLTRKQYDSMKELQKLQPKMKDIREKFKNDKEKMNKEIMDLYRTHKINPLGGCWPVLIQIPVFFALYRALLSSIELRHAPFLFWIQDLSAKDPCYITPIIMGATMFLQQRMTPTAGDPAQQRMMMFMPIIFTFLFLSFPSGLVLYWLVNNVITIGQQYISQKRKH